MGEASTFHSIMTTVSEAQHSICQQAKTFGSERVALAQAFGRVLVQPIRADRDYPPFNRATMDGYAVQSADFGTGNPSGLRITGYIAAGSAALFEVAAGTCSKIMTGAAVPPGADAVIRVEDAQAENGRAFFSVDTVKAGQNIAKRGEDARQNDILISGNQLITPQVVSVLAVAGRHEVEVARLPKVGIVSTGNEVVPVGVLVLPHQIRDSNAWAMRGFLHRYGITDVTVVLAADDKAALAQAVAGLLLSEDTILLSGGVSRGDADYVPEVLQSLGVRQVFHRVRIRPGGPLWFGVALGGKAVFGLPGNPVSVQVGCKLFVEPYLRACFGLPMPVPVYFPMLESRMKKTPFDDFFPCRLITEHGTTGVKPVRYNGSGDIAATLHSHGIALQPAAAEHLAANAPVAFYAW